MIKFHGHSLITAYLAIDDEDIQLELFFLGVSRNNIFCSLIEMHIDSICMNFSCHNLIKLHQSPNNNRYDNCNYIKY
jgi:hypothetical protein